MCLDCLRRAEWKTPCGKLQGSKIATILKTFMRIIKSILSRCLYTLFTFIAIWRVTVALQNPTYWLLLFVLCPLALETVHAIFVRRGNEMKWITPSVFFLLLGGIPCVWLLEIKLLNDRLSELNNETTSALTGNSTQDLSLGINIALSDEGWTLALEQILIFVLVLGKWIAPKGELSRDELSQLLLVNIAAGADIIELLEVFGEENVAQNREIVFLVLAIWSWSLLQFCLVLTATKDLPPLDDDKDEIPINRDDVITNGDTKHDAKDVEAAMQADKITPKDTLMLPGIQRKEKHIGKLPAGGVPTGDAPGSIASNENGKMKKRNVEKNNNAEAQNGHKNDSLVEIGDESHFSGSSPVRKKLHDNLRADEEVENVVKGRYCFECFCCYTEIWGMVMSMCFQDGPFLIIRLFIMLHYRVVTHMNVFFTCKNVLVILLLLNRIRVIVLEEQKTWKTYMIEVKRRRDLEGDERRRKLGLPPKKRKDTKDRGARRRKKEVSDEGRPTTAEPIPKPRWVIWRA